MKVNILTFHYANNYGAVLQCYGLSSTLINLGYEVEIINLRPKTDDQSFKQKISNYILSRQFVIFNSKYLPSFTKEFNSFEDLSSYNFEADIYIVGSDQVWNLDITKEKFLAYFFEFLKEDQFRISYAASFGNSNWDWSSETNRVKNSLLKFNAVGIREEQGVKIARDTFEIQATQVLDPTLLLNSSDYNKLVSSSKIGIDRIVTYKFNKPKEWYSTLFKLQDLTNYRVICLNDNKLIRGLKFSYFTSVNNWLAAIKNSSLVITDSFHCMVFAIIFKKQFIAMPANAKRTSRMLSLLKQLGLESRYLTDFSELLELDILFNKIDYDQVHLKINDLRIISKDFLKNAISSKN